MAQKPFAVVPEPFTLFTAGPSDAAYPSGHVSEYRHVGLIWRAIGAGGSGVFLGGNFATSRPIDFCSILQTTAAATSNVRLRLFDGAGATGTTLLDVAPTIISPAITRDDGLYSAHIEFAEQSARSFLLEFNNVGNPFDVGKVILGRRLTFANYYSPGFGFGAEDLGDLELTRWGVPDEEDGLIFRRLDCTFGWMSRADMDDKFRPLVERLGRRGVALFCFDPEPTTYRQARTYFGWLRQPPFFRGAVNKFDRFESEWSILSMI